MCRGILASFRASTVTASFETSFSSKNRNWNRIQYSRYMLKISTAGSLELCDMIFICVEPESYFDIWASHRVGRVLNFFSSRRNWDSPNSELASEGLGESQFWRGDITVVLFIYTYFVKPVIPVKFRTNRRPSLYSKLWIEKTNVLVDIETEISRNLKGLGAIEIANAEVSPGSRPRFGFLRPNPAENESPIANR